MVRSRSRPQSYLTLSPSPAPTPTTSPSPSRSPSPVRSPYPCPYPYPSLSPSQIPPESRPVSAFLPDRGCDRDLDAANMPSSRLASSVLLPSALLLPTSSASFPLPAPEPTPAPPSFLAPPTLAEILSNTSSPPWTLAAFMGYLSQNHCMETLEFTMDAQRYRDAYIRLAAARGVEPTARFSSDHLCSLWDKLMQAYIVPCAPREINVPSRVREGLLGLRPTTVPPLPSELDKSVEIVYELMNDSVLLPFIESMSGSAHLGSDARTASSPAALPAVTTALTVTPTPAAESRPTARTILGIPKHKHTGSAASSPSNSSPSSPSSDQPHSARTLHHHRQHNSHHHLAYPLLHHSHQNQQNQQQQHQNQQPQPQPQPPQHSRTGADSPSDSVSMGDFPDREFSDDYSLEAMTPPTTPPTLSVPESPGGLQRVMAAHNSAWKKVKLGFKKKKSGQGASFASYGSGEDLSAAGETACDKPSHEG